MPLVGDDNPLCLKYHVKGRCTKDCSRKDSHIPLPTAVNTKFHSYVDSIMEEL
jgi:hypothetical protein